MKIKNNITINEPDPVKALMFKPLTSHSNNQNIYLFKNNITTNKKHYTYVNMIFYFPLLYPR